MFLRYYRICLTGSTRRASVNDRYNDEMGAHLFGRSVVRRRRRSVRVDGFEYFRRNRCGEKRTLINHIERENHGISRGFEKHEVENKEPSARFVF